MHNDNHWFYVHQVKVRKQYILSVSSSDKFLLKKELPQSKGRKALRILNYRCNSQALSLQKRQMQFMLILRKKPTVFNINRVDNYSQKWGIIFGYYCYNTIQILHPNNINNQLDATITVY